MASIVQLALENKVDWADIAARADTWLSELGLDRRSVILLVPFAQHMALARRAWASRGGWLPRIETTRTLGATLGPASRATDGQISFDASADRLQAARMLRSQSWAPREPFAFDEAVSAVVQTAHAFVKAAHALAPSDRAAHWSRGRECLGNSAGVGVMERGLALMALEWAALAPAASTDRLFDLRPSAWIVVQAGGADPFVRNLMAEMPHDQPCLWMDSDAASSTHLAQAMSVGRCDGFEHEASCAAAQVLRHLQRGQVPVALVAQDRVLTRRVSALLAHQGVSMQDETGWTLSTTRAAAQVMSLLRAAAPRASSDELLDWLKAGAWPSASREVDEIEAACRREAWVRMGAIRSERLRESAGELLGRAVTVLQTLASARRQPLQSWLQLLASALRDCEMLDAMAADDAGEQVLACLHLHDPAAWAAQLAAWAQMSLAEFSAWVDGALEDASFVPPQQPDASVVITPLARLMLRPFAAVVFPGADDQHLGRDAGPHPLLNEAQALVLGVPTARQRREAEELAFAHLTRSISVSFFYRHADAGEPLAPSALLERLALRLRATGEALDTWTEARLPLAIERRPLVSPRPHAAPLMPQHMSASACEALRACPYRFFALYMLRLREPDELDAEVEQRDYGNWLHAVLMTFHQTRGEPAEPAQELARLLRIGHAEKQARGLDDADFLPFEAGFAELAPRYITWLHERDLAGASWWKGEQARDVAPPELEGMRLNGRIDRMDLVRGPHGMVLELIDYKTGNAQALRDKLRQPLEDTQLAFYAALVLREVDMPIQASYLTLGRKIESLPHADVEDSARALVDGMADEVKRIRAGAALPALGEAPTCDHCEARGLCRRDHWSEP